MRIRSNVDCLFYCIEEKDFPRDGASIVLNKNLVKLNNDVFVKNYLINENNMVNNVVDNRKPNDINLHKVSEN